MIRKNQKKTKNPAVPSTPHKAAETAFPAARHQPVDIRLATPAPKRSRQIPDNYQSGYPVRPHRPSPSVRALSVIGCLSQGFFAVILSFPVGLTQGIGQSFEKAGIYARNKPFPINIPFGVVGALVGFGTGFVHGMLSVFDWRDSPDWKMLNSYRN